MKLRLALVAVCLLAAGPALSCDLPKPPRYIPDGETASKQAMLAKKREMDEYVRAVEHYMNCGVNPVQLQSVQDELRRATSRFNAEVRAFKAANEG